MAIINVDHDIVQKLFMEINRQLMVLEMETSISRRNKMLDTLLEGEDSPLRELKKILKVDV